MSKPKRKCWSQSVGVYGSKVRVSELTRGGLLYLLWVGTDGKQHKRSLGHRDRKRGKEEALAFASRLSQDRDAGRTERLTVAKLFDTFVTHGLHGRSASHRNEIDRKLGLWRAFLGPDRCVDTLSPADVDRFVEARRSGLLKPSGRKDKEGTLFVPSNTTIWHDYVALTTALHFGTRHRDERGKALLMANPLSGVRVAKTVTPSQPVADVVLYEALKAVAHEIGSKFALALVLAYATGHRIDAILKLRWDDITFAAVPNAPHGTVRWRGENDKIDNEHVVPMNDLAAVSLQATHRERPAIGEAWVFPSDTDESRPVERRLASRWFRRAEKLAKVDHVKGRGWHSFRRAWASARKHLPDVDVAAAGGWKDTTIMKRCYQHSDPVSVLRVVTAESHRRISG